MGLLGSLAEYDVCYSPDYQAAGWLGTSRNMFDSR
jgi:hypothetical protein